MDSVVITGGTAGVGRAVARIYDRRGHPAAVLARGRDRLAATRAELLELGAPDVLGLEADVGDAARVEAAAAET